MTETVRCKMRVQKIACVAYQDGKGYTIELSPVSDGSPENKEFYKWTPAGKLELMTINEKAARIFQDFGDFYIDITKA